MNYSFYDEMDELNDILNESTDEEIFIESIEELFGYEVTESSTDAVALATAVGVATALGLHEVKKVEKWARSMYHVEVPYKECTHKVIKLTDDTAKELADLFGKTEAWMKHRVSRKCKCHILMHKDDMIYAVLYVATLKEKMQRHNALLEKAFTPNAKRAIGYYSIMLYHKRNIPLSSSGASMLKTYDLHGYTRRNGQAVLYNHKDNYDPSKYEMVESTDEDLFEEKATRTEYAMRRFKERYKYNPSDKTIVVNGTRYKVDLDIAKPIIYVPDGAGGYAASPRQTCFAWTDEGQIILDKKFFQLKDDKRRAAVLQHEVGHGKLHNTTPGNKTADRSKISRTMIMDEIAEQEEELKKYYKRIGFSDKETAEYVQMWKDGIKPNIDGYLKMSTASEVEDKIRASARAAARKYVPKHNPNLDKTHTNANEFEADRYAANKVGERYIKRGARETMKMASKPKEVKNMMNATGRASYANAKAADKAGVFSPKDARGIKTTKADGNKYMIPMNSQKAADKINEDLPILSGKQAYVVNDARKAINKGFHAELPARSKALKDKELRNNPSLK